jgi:hypothetical protein
VLGLEPAKSMGEREEQSVQDRMLPAEEAASVVVLGARQQSRHSRHLGAGDAPAKS